MGLSRCVNAVLALALLHPIPGGAGDNAPAYPGRAEGNWTTGDSWTDPPPRPGPRSPSPTDDPVILATDAYLGFYLTRDRAVFAPGAVRTNAPTDPHGSTPSTTICLRA